MRPRIVWIIFAACLVVVLVSMAWISQALRDSDREGRQLAELEGRARIALWRMDSALVPIITQEMVRPTYEYQAFYRGSSTYRPGYNRQVGELWLPSPLLDHKAKFVKVHFQVGARGGLTSPQVPSVQLQKSLGTAGSRPENIKRARETLLELKQKLSGLKNQGFAQLSQLIDDQQKLVPSQSARQAQNSVQPSRQDDRRSSEQRQLQARGQRRDSYLNRRQNVELQQDAVQSLWTGNDLRTQQALSVLEFDNRSLNCAPLVMEGLVERLDLGDDGENSNRANIIRPVWIGEELLLARNVIVEGESVVQGCWLDWPAMSEWLLGGVEDLLPDASLKIVSSPEFREDERRLAAIPVSLITGALEGFHDDDPTVQSSLQVAWICVSLAAVAVAVLLLGALTLSERRRGFVAAVTHELRTPLTTFRLYTEMLSENMVKDETKRQGYLGKLRTEADRLSHLVENVLAYARLEAGRTRRNVKSMSLEELVREVEGRLRERTHQSGVILEVTLEADAAPREVVVDLSAIEQILINLVDNSCKYGVETEPVIFFEVDRSNQRARLRVRDHGPGVSSEARRRLFKPFSKSVGEAARSAPGVGLGLSLSRRFAREMGGDLHCLVGGNGACFELSLPLKSSRP